MIETMDQLNRTHRALVTGETKAVGKARSVQLTRTYDAPVDDVWDACTTAERIGRWLTPVSGDLRLGGTFQLEGNASGTILKCEAPRVLRVTWVFGENKENNTSEVEVRLSPTADGTGTHFELEHAAVDADADFWAQFGPGATGVGWDLGLLGLAGHLAGMEFDKDYLATPEAREFVTASGNAWREAHVAAGASAEEAKGAADRTIAAFTEG